MRYLTTYHWHLSCMSFVRRRVAGVGLYGTPAFTEDELTQLVGDCEKKTKMHPLNMNLTTDTTTEAKQ